MVKTIAIIVSEFNRLVTEPLLAGAQSELHAHLSPDMQLHIDWVPGAVEIPLMAQHRLREPGMVAAVALGAVIRGETDHYDYVCQQVSYGCQRVALDLHKPVIFGVLTVDNLKQAQERLGGTHGHKGREAAQCALKMIQLLSV